MIVIGIFLFVTIVIMGRLLLSNSSNESPFTRDLIVQALTRLGELAQANGGHTITLVVVGGSALVLRYNARESTQDVDAFMGTPPERQNTRAWAATVAQELGLRSDWLNDGAKGFMRGVSYGPLLIEAPGIKVYQVSSEQLLAMKLSAWRDLQDSDDATVVLRDLTQTYSTKESLWNAIAPYATSLKAQYAFQQLWEELND